MAGSRDLVKIIACTLCVVQFFTITLADGHRLNVPRVLIPVFHDFPVNFTLEVTEGGCYQWWVKSVKSLLFLQILTTFERKPFWFVIYLGLFILSFYEFTYASFARSFRYITSFAPGDSRQAAFFYRIQNVLNWILFSYQLKNPETHADFVCRYLFHKVSLMRSF